MKIKNRNLLIAVFITSLLAVFIFLINDNNAELGPSFGAYVKLEFARYFGIAVGIISLLCAVALTLTKRRKYIEKLVYIFPGVFNLSLGFYGLIYFFSTNNRIVLHEFLINLLIGILIISDIFFIESG